MRWVDRRYRIRGLVQGVGFRPFIAELAEQMGISGEVANSGGSVSLRLTGEEKAVDEMIRRLFSLCGQPVEGIVHGSSVATNATGQGDLPISLPGARVDTTGQGDLPISLPGAPVDTTGQGDLPISLPGSRVDAAQLLSEKVLESAPDAPFRIIDSDAAHDGIRLLPPDIATCPACEKELFDPSNRRYRHPFISCVSCGPRFTIMNRLPYDRDTTTMDRFAMCPACEREYLGKRIAISASGSGSIVNRRAFAQTNCCPDCGPVVKAAVFAPGTHSIESLSGEDAISAAIRILQNGGIAAIKDVGGYHFAHLASDAAAARRLRQIKARDGKPFAVMFADIDQVREVAVVSEQEAVLLNSPERPIVLLRRRPENTVAKDGKLKYPVQEAADGKSGLGVQEAADGKSGLGVQEAADGRSGLTASNGTSYGEGTGNSTAITLADEICAGSPRIGAMLPCNPLSMLIVRATGPIVMTSGNLGGEPILASDEEMLELAGSRDVCDIVLYHDRPIRQGLDDSICQVIFAGDRVVTQILRRARGYVPQPVYIPGQALPTVPSASEDVERSAIPHPDSEDVERSEPPGADTDLFAAGGDLKAAFALRRGDCVFLSGHFGDLDEVHSQQAWLEAADHLQTLLDIHPKRFLRDLHPVYVSGKLCQRLAARRQPSAEADPEAQITETAMQHLREHTPEISVQPHREHAPETAMQHLREQTPEISVQPHREHTPEISVQPHREHTPEIAVQHHHAHILSVMAEHGLSGKVLGVAYDGTGFGTDGSIWGGEFLLCEGKDFRRVGHLLPVEMMAGDVSAIDCDSAAYAYLLAYDKVIAEEFAQQRTPDKAPDPQFAQQRTPDKAPNPQFAQQNTPDKAPDPQFAQQRPPDKAPDPHFAQQNTLHTSPAPRFALWRSALRQHIHTIPCSSMGRLFDAAAAILDICHKNTYEGQAPMMLQAAAERYEQQCLPDPIDTASDRENLSEPHLDTSRPAAQKSDTTPLCIPILDTEDGSFSADPRPLLAKLWRRRQAGESSEYLAWAFHRAVAEMTAAGCRRIAGGAMPIAGGANAITNDSIPTANEASSIAGGALPIALSGGTMQNALLLRMILLALEKAGLKSYLNEQVPCGDGGLALGQAYYGILCEH